MTSLSLHVAFLARIMLRIAALVDHFLRVITTGVLCGLYCRLSFVMLFPDVLCGMLLLGGKVSTCWD